MVRSYGAIAAYVLRQVRIYFHRKQAGPGVSAPAHLTGPPAPRQHGRLRVPLQPKAVLSAFALCCGLLLFAAALFRIPSHTGRYR